MLGTTTQSWGDADEAVLRSAGVDVVGFDAWRPSIERYASDGGTTASSMIECAKGAEVFLLMVINAAQAEQVLFEQNALASEFRLT